jgi:hypothetical protein
VLGAANTPETAETATRRDEKDTMIFFVDDSLIKKSNLFCCGEKSP